MSRCAVEVEIVFLDVLSVIAFGIGQAEETLLEYRILAVPQSERKAQALLVVTKTGEAVLTPMIGARPGLIVGEVIPRVAGLAVIFADRAPLAFAEVRPPLPPWYPLLTRLGQPRLFRCVSPSRIRTLDHSLPLPWSGPAPLDGA